MELILASQSPRRHEIMRIIGIPFKAVVCSAPETVPTGCSTAETVMHLAHQKAAYALALSPDACVIGADTVVDLDGTILGKPASPADAIATLKRMQGRSHVVYTGVAVLKKDYADLRYAMTKVAFRPMTDKEIEWYVSTGEPLDKAGSYGVQGLASVFVERIEGDYFNVIGLPASLLYEMLLKAGAVTEDRK